MSEQYFKAEPTSQSKRESYRFDFGGQDFWVQTDAGVFSREGLDEGSKLMLLTVLPELQGKVLDLGCGWGAVGLIAGKLKPNLGKFDVSFDVSPVIFRVANSFSSHQCSISLPDLTFLTAVRR